jgi:Ca2+-binding RTX toxin-like protein
MSGLLPSGGIVPSTLDEILVAVRNVGSDNLAVTTDGVTTTLTGVSASVSLPTLVLSTFSQAGQVTFANGMHFMTGSDAGETYSGTGGDDAVYSMGGNDRIDGGAGHDYSYGGSGSDTIYGGEGNDHLYGYGSAPGPDGADMIFGGFGDDYVQGNSGSDMLDGGEGNDRVLGGADDDRIVGGLGDDALNGNFGNDTIDGGDGNDVVRGGKNDDVVSGGAGDDHIHGDLGADTLTGGTGADVFHFTGNDAALVSTMSLTGDVDTITDFSIGEDHLALGFAPTEIIHGSAQSSVATALTYATSVLAGHNGSVVAVDVGSDTVLFYNSGGGSVVDSVVDLQGVHASSVLTASFV